MFYFILRRFLQAIPVLAVIVTVTFFMIRLAPGGPFAQEKRISPQILEKLRGHYGLNDPLMEQFIRYLKNLMSFDFGPSYVHLGQTVNELIAESFPVSLELGLYSMLIAIMIGIPVGIIAAIRRNSKYDYISMSLSMIGICLPTFILGPILILVFGLWLKLLNVSGWNSWDDRILPSLTLGLLYAAYIARLMRVGMLEVLSMDYIRTAKAKGLNDIQIVVKHAFRGGILPVISFLGPAFAGLISGSFVVETIFQVPGLGRHFVNAAFNRDYTMILGTVLFYSVLIIIFNLIVDIIQAFIDPRIRNNI